MAQRDVVGDRDGSSRWWSKAPVRPCRSAECALGIGRLMGPPTLRQRPGAIGDFDYMPNGFSTMSPMINT